MGKFGRMALSWRKICSKCGTIHDKKLSDRVTVCDCRNVMNRDFNAAMNLKN